MGSVNFDVPVSKHWSIHNYCQNTCLWGSSRRIWCLGPDSKNGVETSALWLDHRRCRWRIEKCPIWPAVENWSDDPGRHFYCNSGLVHVGFILICRLNMEKMASRRMNSMYLCYFKRIFIQEIAGYWIFWGFGSLRTDFAWRTTFELMEIIIMNCIVVAQSHWCWWSAFDSLVYSSPSLSSASKNSFGTSLKSEIWLSWQNFI